MFRICSGRPIGAFLVLWLLGAAAVSFYTTDISGQRDSRASTV